MSKGRLEEETREEKREGVKIAFFPVASNTLQTTFPSPTIPQPQNIIIHSTFPSSSPKSHNLLNPYPIKMGISFSNNRRRNNHYLHHPPPQYLSPSSSSSYFYPQEPQPPPPPPPPLPPHNCPYPPPHHPYPTHLHPPPPAPPPPPPPPAHNYYYSGGYNPITARFNYHQYYANQPNGWPTPRPVGPPVEPPRYVEHQNAKKVRNDVNVNKETLRIEVDEDNPDQYLVSFVFDALYDGSITIFYFAKEEPNCTFVPALPEIFRPVTIPFQKGTGQKFRQPSGTGIDLGFFELDDLSKPSPREDIFPLVVSAKTCLPPHSTDEHIGEPVSNTNSNMQFTQAVLEKNNDDPFQVRVVKQILWIDRVRYELREIYGIGNSTAESFDDNDTGKECVICMTEPKDTTVLPCRHMCLCSECAKALRLQSNKCPICRQPIEELLEIKINNGDQ